MYVEFIAPTDVVRLRGVMMELKAEFIMHNKCKRDAIQELNYLSSIGEKHTPEYRHVYDCYEHRCIKAKYTLQDYLRIRDRVRRLEGMVALKEEFLEQNALKRSQIKYMKCLVYNGERVSDQYKMAYLHSTWYREQAKSALKEYINLRSIVMGVSV
jgi:hypothetical protein